MFTQRRHSFNVDIYSTSNVRVIVPGVIDFNRSNTTIATWNSRKGIGCYNNTIGSTYFCYGGTEAGTSSKEHGTTEQTIREHDFKSMPNQLINICNRSFDDILLYDKKLIIGRQAACGLEESASLIGCGKDCVLESRTENLATCSAVVDICLRTDKIQKFLIETLYAKISSGCMYVCTTTTYRAAYATSRFKAALHSSIRHVVRSSKQECFQVLYIYG